MRLSIRKISARPRRLAVATLTSAAGYALLFAALVSLVAAAPSFAQKEKKKKKDAKTTDSAPLLPLPDEQQIEYRISEMLGAWQLGDVDRLHQTYADDVVFVSGVWAPPIFGWANYLPIYQQQRARMQQVRMDRTNTYIKVSGNVGWACYQWDFTGTVDGNSAASKGQTTLVLEKRNTKWVIVHNHTSVAQPMPAAVPRTDQPPPANNPPAGQQPNKPPR
jgi:ketosteroid isomerase-like protein